MTSVSFKVFEAEVKRTVLIIQSELQKLENVHRFTVSFEADGRVDGDFKIAYRVSCDYESSVVGNDMQKVMVESMRRKGWQDTNAPKAISHITGKEIESDDV